MVHVWLDDIWPKPLLITAFREALRSGKMTRSSLCPWKVNTDNVAEVAKACKGATCVVSALAGLHDVIIDTQKVLLDAAVQERWKAIQVRH